MLQTVANSADRPSRAAIASATGLTRATVSALVDDLIAGGLLTEHDPAPRTGAGRPAAGLALNAAGPAGLGLEINVDYLAACVVSLTGSVRHRFVEHGDQRPLPPAASLGALDALAARAREAAAAEGLTLAGAALAVPGLVAAEGLVRVAPNLGWQDVDVPALLPGLADLGLTVDNEANLAALGELRAAPDELRAASGEARAATGEVRAATGEVRAAAGTEPTFLYVSGEIGIGAGIVLDGELYRGGRGWSGEIGHVTVFPDGRPCRCGASGCLEQYAGQEAMAADAGLAASALGIALSAVVNLLDIGVIVLGGAYGPELPRLRAGIEAELGRRVLTAGLAPVALRAAAMGTDAAIRGAANAVIQAVREDPAAWLSR